MGVCVSPGASRTSPGGHYFLTCDTDDQKRLRAEQREDDGTEDGGKEHLIYAVVGVGAGEHVQGEGQGGEDAGGGDSGEYALEVTSTPVTRTELPALTGPKGWNAVQRQRLLCGPCRRTGHVGCMTRGGGGGVVQAASGEGEGGSRRHVSREATYLAKYM